MKLGLVSVLIFESLHHGANGHGLVEDPPSRNWFCGGITKPHEVDNGVAQYPECGTAFKFQQGGYQFMSVLTHNVGRSGVSPLPNHVCGFDSETWFGGRTPWDAAMDWPTSPITAGRNEFKWNIFWGPHFDDTEEFRYWITKPAFQFDPNAPLSWNDFEDSPFCLQKYNHDNPNGNLDVIPLTDSAAFLTFCNVPERDGRHVIYAEWGRNQWTYERFHGCIDVQFSPSSPMPPSSPAPTNFRAPSPMSPPMASSTNPPVPSPSEAPTPVPTDPPAGPPSNPPITSEGCNLAIQPGANPWFAGFLIGFDEATATLDFSNTGLDLSQVTVQEGAFFPLTIVGQTITLTKPAWVSKDGSQGYLGFNGNNVAALATLDTIPPECAAGFVL
jgi:predicted carbohydrate-binding protein with CBM5 and CBM33 domain